MPITQWICKGCGGRLVPLDHFATTRCGETVCHPDYAAAVLADRAAQPTGTVRVTMGLGCQRRHAIEASEGYAVDPLDLLAPMTGTAWHRAVEGAEGSEVPVAGTLAGMRVEGRVDRLRGDLIEDWKCQETGSLKYLRQDDGSYRAKPEHVVQVSLYAELAEQSGLRRPTRGIIWVKEFKRMQPVPTSLWPVEKALEFHPLGGNYSVSDLYRQSSAANSWQGMPKAGESQMYGAKSACNWCSVRNLCQGEF